jgi:putative oxidoreductase
LQRLFSTFADGFPGGGILLLRLLAGGVLINQGIAAMHAGTHTALVVQIFAAAAGLLIVGGLWTPAAGVLTGMAELWLAFTQPGTQLLAIMLAGMAISLAMIGPGAWSIDARRYGRKQLLPPEP